MGVISKINTQQARLNPEREFDEPQQIVDEIGLTAGQKLAALKRWAQAVEERLGASSGGADLPRDVALLERIRAAAHTIERA